MIEHVRFLDRDHSPSDTQQTNAQQLQSCRKVVWTEYRAEWANVNARHLYTIVHISSLIG